MLPVKGVRVLGLYKGHRSHPGAGNCHIYYTAFSQTDLFLAGISREFRLLKEPW